MKTARIRKKGKKETKIVEQEYSIKSLVKIILTISIIFCSFYLITKLLVKPSSDNEVNQSVIDNTKITMNQLLNRKSNEYYVLATKESLYNKTAYHNTSYMQIYNSYINKYIEKDDSLEFYYIDLDNALNKTYFGEKMNITDDISKIVLNDEVLFKIKNGKIEKTYIGKDKIIDKLSRL